MHKKTSHPTSYLSRRQIIKGMGGLSLAFGLAACAPNSTPTSNATPTATKSVPQPTPTQPKPSPTSTKESSGQITNVFTYRGHNDSINQAAWSPNNLYIASASEDGTAQIWTPANGKALLTYKGLNGPVKSVSWSPDSKRIVVAGDTVQVVEATTGKLVLTFNQNNNIELSVSWSPDGKYIACVGEDNRVFILEAATGKVLNSHTIGSDGSGGTSLAWSSYTAHPRIAATANDGTVQSWDALTGQNVITYNVGATVNALAWIGDAATTPINQLLVFACQNDTTQVWHAATNTKLSSYATPDYVLTAAASHSKDVYIVAGVNDNSVPVWKLATGQQICNYKGHTDSVNTVSWSYGPGLLIASGGKDKTVQVWQPPLQ